MIASVLQLNPMNIKKLRIRDAYGIHKAVYSLFPGDSRDFLYLDKGGNRGKRLVLVLSVKEPIVPEEGSLETKWVPEAYLNHSIYAFEVRVNPVYRKTGNKSPVPVTGEEALKSWFRKREKDWGFTSRSDSLEISDTGYQTFEKNGNIILHNKATFRGILEVKDKAQFKKSFSQGIGRGKAFGFGLLQIKPIKE